MPGPHGPRGYGTRCPIRRPVAARAALSCACRRESRRGSPRSRDNRDSATGNGNRAAAGNLPLRARPGPPRVVKFTCTPDVRARSAVSAQQPGQRSSRACGVAAAPGQQSGPGDGRERDGRQLLRVIGEACARVRLGPAPVEDELAPRVRLRVARHGTDQRASVVPQNDVLGLPSRLAANAVAGFERLEERVAQERVVARVERIPVRRRNLREASDVVRVQTHRSAGAFSGRRRAARGTCPRRAPPCSRCRPR